MQDTQQTKQEGDRERERKEKLEERERDREKERREPEREREREREYSCYQQLEERVVSALIKNIIRPQTTLL